MAFDLRKYNRQAWDSQVENGNQWTIPVSSEKIQNARNGNWDIVMTPHKPVPKIWFPGLKGANVLCLASGGGQQGPILAAAGAKVTVFDNSPKQLEKDRLVAERDGLHIETIEGDMRDLSVFTDECFELIVHPVSNCFVPDTKLVWREAYRILKPEGTLIAGMVHPFVYIFEQKSFEKGIYTIQNSIPYSDLESLTEDQLNEFFEKNYPIEFGHSLEDLIGGQIEAGFKITGFYEDTWNEHPISKFIPTFFTTRAQKL